jgi:hypothetical protein
MEDDLGTPPEQILKQISVLIGAMNTGRRIESVKFKHEDREVKISVAFGGDL